MTTYYLDISAIGNEYQAYAATPTWGAGASDKPLPMDGNGLAGPGHSAAVAIAEIQITVLPGDTNTLTIAGAVLTAKTTVAAKNQFAIGGSIATCVSNIVSLVNTYGTGNNQCDAVVNTGSSAIQLALPYWQYARVKPGTTDTVQIATRFAGSTLNQATNSNVAISSSGWGTPPTITQFAGGADGPFAYWWNTSTVFGKAITTQYPNYGVSVAAAGGPAAVASTDPVIVRTERSGADLNPGLFTATGQINITFLARTFIFDNGTTWSNDNGQFVVQTYSASGSSTSVITLTSPTVWIARSKYNMSLTHSGINLAKTVAISENNTSAATTLLMNLLFQEGSGASLSFPFGPNQYRRTAIGCKFIAEGARSLGGTHANATGWSCRYIDCDFEYTVAGPTPSGLFTLGYAGVSNDDCIVEMSNCRFTFASGGPITQLFTGAISPYSNFRCTISDCTGLRPDTLPGTAGQFSGNRAQVFIGCADSASGVSGRSTLIDTGQLQQSWIDNGTSPYLNATTPTGSSWSIKAILKNVAAAYTPVEIARLMLLYREADASKIIRVELLVPAAADFKTSRLGVYGTFTNAAGNIEHFTTLTTYAADLIGSGTTSLASSTASWTNPGTMVAKKIEFDTSDISKEIKQNTEVSIRIVHIGATPTAADVTLYVHPEIVLA